MTYNDQKKPKHVLVILNPMAGRCHRRRLEAILSALGDRGCEVEVHTTEDRGDAEKLAEQIDPERVDVIAVAGGDGTINEVLNGIDAAAPPIAIVPLGTANVLAAEIGLGSTPEAIADTIAFGRPRPISLGCANGRRFAVMASAGLDAEIVRHVSLPLKRYLGKGAYAYETLHQLFAFHPPAYQLSIEGKTCEAHGVVIANGRFFGGRFVVAPNASLEKPSFDICCCTRGGRAATLQYLVSMIRGSLPDRPDYEIIAAPKLRISGPKDAVVQADGDIVTHLPAEVSIQPNAVELMFPGGMTSGMATS
ncbi:MAG: diacylglycerol/lipid kinase family protein [Geminicoccaceae bacterium]